MRVAKRFSRILDQLAALAKDRRGVSAVEFALVLPFLAMLYMMGSDTSMWVSVNRKIHNASATIDDLVTQSEGMTSNELDALMNVTASLVEPYDQNDVFLRVTQVKIDGNGKQTVDWTRSRNPMSGYAVIKKGDPYTLPADFKAERNLYVIVTEAYFDFYPVGGYGLTGPIRMGETSYLYPRIGTSITCSGC